MSASSIARSQTLAIVASALLAALALLPLAEVWRQSPDLRHGWAAALLAAYLWWERWAERPVAVGRNGLTARWWLLAVALGVAALPLRLLLTPFPLWTMVVWAYVAVCLGAMAAAMWLRSGWAGVRWLLAPCVILLSALPWPSFFEQSAILPLREGMAALSAEISNLLGRPALAGGTSVRLATGWVGIDEACGGIRSLQACVMIALFFGEWFRFGWKRRLALLAGGVGAALLGNFSRVLFLSLRASGGGAAAVDGAHDVAGWVALVGSLSLTALLAWRWAGWRWPAMTPAAARPTPTTASPAGAWLAAVAGLLVLNEAGARWWFAGGSAERPPVPQWRVALPEEHWSFVREPLGEYAAEMLRPDHYAAGRWQEARDVDAAAYYIEWRHGQAARFLPFAHNPTVCLPLAGCELEESLGEIAVRLPGLTIPFHAYRFRRAGDELWVAFTIWDPSRGRRFDSPESGGGRWRSWSGRWREVRERREHQPAQLFTLAVQVGRGDPESILQEAIRKRIVE